MIPFVQRIWTRFDDGSFAIFGSYIIFLALCVTGYGRWFYLYVFTVIIKHKTRQKERERERQEQKKRESSDTTEFMHAYMSIELGRHDSMDSIQRKMPFSKKLPT